ncbi:AsmA-like C-terminal region-containing protein [Cognatiyoonia sp. IB215446]|uniref:YhdP family protein n=1 Tax=Cognatiyoonia sp. IB215446 TaxID=3097355 RepID=UPI002A0D3796|nr:AsmA-like C-terminal region-containing protein [Cognatiyoonia sp. IB215446]MDX8348691.1 AsmA-like C-terminal region-containing protein [Cognatiyoonia sp. IB215446]
MDAQDHSSDDETAPVAAQLGKRRLGRWVFALRAIYLICLAPLIFALAAAVMIVERDISVPSWIMERIETRATSFLDGGALQFGAVSLRIGKDLHPTIRLQNIVLTDASGLVITRVPVVEGLISPRGLLFQQDVLAQEIRLIGAQINLRRGSDGSFAVAFAAGAGDIGQAPSGPELLDQLDRVFERPELEALETVRAEGMIVNFDDARAGRAWVVDNGTVTLDLRNDQTNLRGDFALLSGRDGVTGVRISYQSPRGSRVADFGLNITDAVASDIAAQSPALTWMRDVEAPITASLRTSLDADGQLGLLNAALQIGAGALQPNAATAPLTFDEARAYLTYDPVRDSIAFSDIGVRTAWGGFQANGTAYLREFQGGLPRALLAQFSFADVVIDPPGLFETPPQMPEMLADLRVRFDPFSVEIGQMVINDGPTQVVADGAVTATDEGWRIALDTAVSEITPEHVLAFWPRSIKPGTRDWVARNIIMADIFDGYASIRRSPGRPLELAANFEFQDAEVRFLRHMPSIRDGRGAVSLGNHAFVVTLDEGVVDAPQGGPVQLAGSVFELNDLRVKPAIPAHLNLVTDSSVTAILSVLNQRPFTFMDRANLPVTVADGRAQVQGTLDWPLKHRARPDEVTFEMVADVARVRSDLIPNRPLAAPRLRVVANRAGMELTGPVSLNGTVADAVWERPFGGPANGTSQVRAEVELSPDFLRALQINLPDGSVTGRSAGQLTIDLAEGTPPRFLLQSDMRGLRVAIPAVGWSKPPDAAGALRVEGILGDIPEITNLEISGAGLAAQGRVTLSAAGGLETAVFSNVRVADWLDAPVTLRGRGEGRPVGVEIGGGTLDLRRAALGGGEGESGLLDLALDRLQITEGIALTAFRGNFRNSDGFTGQFQARVNGETAVHGTVAQRNGRVAVRLLSDNAGGALRAAGFMRNASGGSLDLTLLPTGAAGQFDGTLRVRSVRVQEAPTMAALLDAISVVGLLQQLDGQGLSFDQVDATFRLTPARVIVSQASAVGPGLGISVDGTYTLANGALDLQGVVSPFYLVNSIGSFLTRKGEGLIGFNFNIGGTATTPEVLVNPLSALTPGMFREIFRRPAPELSQ